MSARSMVGAILCLIAAVSGTLLVRTPRAYSAPPKPPHWAFVAPTKPVLPAVDDSSWPRNPIDYFILAKLNAAGLKPNPEADRTTLIRRVSLDLTGLPPTPAQVDAFLADSSPDAYEKVVDQLLKSPRYGEHMAHYWLDAARYGDTHGLHLDNFREIWPYREWVIRSFNANQSYDQFVIEQLAGDLLPHPTLDQLIATGFNRCHVTSNEGGAIEEEFYVRNVVDRVDTLGTVFLGLTTGCCRCHDHKYDPIKTKDYYQFFAFFNSLGDAPLDGNSAQYAPIAKVASSEQLARLSALEQRVAEFKKNIADELAKVHYEEPVDAKESAPTEPADYVWIEDALPAGVRAVADGGVNGAWHFVDRPAPVFSGDKAVMGKFTGLGQFVFQDANPGLVVGEGDRLFAYVYLDPAQPPHEIMLQWHTRDWLHRAFWGADKIDWGSKGTTQRVRLGDLPEKGKWVRLEVEAAKVGLKPGTTINGWAFTQFGGTVYWDHAGLVTRTPQSGQAVESLTAWLRQQQSTHGGSLKKELQDIVKIAPEKRSGPQQKQLRDYFLQHVYTKTRATFDPLNKRLAEVEKEREQFDKQIPVTLVCKELASPKPAYVLKRGEYDQRGEQVERALPAFLPPLPSDAPRNRLGLARWLVSPEHPLTARVQVNRLWQQCFGTGIVKTTEDFGTQGQAPSHPELLDWLAVTFREEGWDTKRMLRLIVTSAAYRQSARGTPQKLAKDPDNRLLSRGPRFRLDAEVIRDQALYVSGLLVEKLGGPSVKPPQPAGLWLAVGYSGSNTVHFTPDTGYEKVHRRSLYTFWKRTSSPPQMSTLDAPSRESCFVRRERTDTPLQALLLMNETQFVECSRALAEWAMHEAAANPQDRLKLMFRLATSRKPDAKEMAELQSALNDHLANFRRDVDGAKKLIAVGETKPDPALNPSELAAYTMVGNLLLNLDEVLNK